MTKLGYTSDKPTESKAASSEYVGYVTEPVVENKTGRMITAVYRNVVAVMSLAVGVLLIPLISWKIELEIRDREFVVIVLTVASWCAAHYYLLKRRASWGECPTFATTFKGWLAAAIPIGIFSWWLTLCRHGRFAQVVAFALPLSLFFTLLARQFASMERWHRVSRFLGPNYAAAIFSGIALFLFRFTRIWVYTDDLQWGFAVTVAFQVYIFCHIQNILSSTCEHLTPEAVVDRLFLDLLFWPQAILVYFGFTARGTMEKCTGAAPHSWN